MSSTSPSGSVTARSILARFGQQEELNFLLTNRIPRRLATQFVGWVSKVRQPLVRDVSIGLWAPKVSSPVGVFFFVRSVPLLPRPPPPGGGKAGLRQSPRLLHPRAEA